jgi:hypothetical protein
MDAARIQPVPTLDAAGNSPGLFAREDSVTSMIQKQEMPQPVQRVQALGVA